MATTNGAGIYRFEAVDLGAHEPKIAHAGFKSFEASGLSVEANRTAVVDIELELGSEAVTIQVGAASGMIAKDGPLRGGNFSATQVSQLPLTGLNPFSLARTLPGVIIGLGREHSYERLERVIERALALGCSDVEAIRYLLLESRLQRKPPEQVDTAALAGYDRPLPTLTDYDRLLSMREARA